MERLRGEVSFLLSSHILSEVEACCDRMIILSHGQIVAEGTLLELQRKFVNKTIFEIVAVGNRIDLQKVVRLVDPSCELIQDDPVEVSKRSLFFQLRKVNHMPKKFLKPCLQWPSACRNFKFQDLIGNNFFACHEKIGRASFWQKKFRSGWNHLQKA